MSRFGKAAKKKQGTKKSETKQSTFDTSRAPIIQIPVGPKVGVKREKKPITKEDMAQMGFSETEVKMMEDLSAIKSLSPFMAVVRCDQTFKFSVGQEKNTQILRKGSVYVMALGVYDSLRYNQQLGRDILKPYKHNFAEVFNRYEGQNLDGKTILIWRTGGIGDLLFIKPNIDYIKKTWPTAKVWFACAPAYQNMVKHWKEIDRLIDLPIDYYEVFRKADYHVTFEGTIERNFEAHKRNAYELFSEFMGLNLKGNDLVPHQDVPEIHRPVCEEFLKSKDIGDEKFILLQMQPSSPVRAIRGEKWVEVIDELTDRGHKVVITDSPYREQHVASLISKCKNRGMVFNFCKHSKTLDVTITLCSYAKGTIGPDSSLNHIAASLGVPSYGIFGPFTGEIRMSHFPNAGWINCQYKCAPCFMHGGEPCPVAKKNNTEFSPCLENFTAAEIADGFEKLLS